MSASTRNGNGIGRLKAEDKPNVAHLDFRLAAAENLVDGDRLVDNDPRRDRDALEIAMTKVRRLGWSRGFGECAKSLAGTFSIDGSSKLVGIQASRSESDPLFFEGFKVVSSDSTRSIAGLFEKFLNESHSIEFSKKGKQGAPLFADLIGSTLIDAQVEARSAWRALEKAGRSERWIKRFESAPPWPPASVLKLKRKQTEKGEDSQPLLEALAAQIAPDASARKWLLESWRRPERALDDGLLLEISAAANHRVFAETRFREWLRAEWTASARQRFSWIARHAGDEF